MNDGPTTRPLADLVADPDLLTAVTDVYRACFLVPPWNENETHVVEWLARTMRDAGRPGARLALAKADGRVVGFATGWATPDPFPTGGPSYDAIVEALGATTVAHHLVGAMEVDELAVDPGHRRGGVGRTLLASLVDPLTGAWLVTSPRAEAAVGLYRSLGWSELHGTVGSGSEVLVFVSPGGSAPVATS